MSASISKTFSLKAAGPRPCYRAALASDKMCCASFCLPRHSPGIEPKEAHPQGLMKKFHFCHSIFKSSCSEITIVYEYC